MCLTLAVAGCSPDKACMSEWITTVGACFHTYYTCQYDNGGDLGYTPACGDDHEDCYDEAWASMGRCAEPGGCLDQYVECWEYVYNYHRSYDEPVCAYGLEECVSWYDLACEDSCYEQAGKMDWGEGWLGERDHTDWIYECMGDCL